MKYEQIAISVTHNGYLVETKTGNYQPHLESWTFESMKKLQERLPEILELSIEKRTKP